MITLNSSKIKQYEQAIEFLHNYRNGIPETIGMLEADKEYILNVIYTLTEIEKPVIYKISEIEHLRDLENILLKDLHSRGYKTEIKTEFLSNDIIYINDIPTATTESIQYIKHTTDRDRCLVYVSKAEEQTTADRYN